MRILYVAQRVPFPPDRGDKILTYHQICRLARRHEVAVACLADGPEDLANVSALAGMVESVDVVPLSRRRARLRAAMAPATHRPFTVAYFDEPELHRKVAARLASRPFDAIVVYSSGMAQFVEKIADTPRIMQLTDLDSLKWEQYARLSRFPMAWVYRTESRRLLAYERRLAATFSHCVLCTPKELDDFRRLIPGAAAECVSNGVDLAYYRPRGTPRKNALIFTGVMDYLPNVDGVVWFCREILPQVRQQVPDVTFIICGARPNATVQALGRLPSVVITGNVPDVRPYLSQASVGVVPLRIARGIQNKILEAMASGLAVVATTAAYTGIEAVSGRDLFIADDPGAFAAKVIQLLEDEDLRRMTGRAARACMEANYDWDIRLEALERLLIDVVARERKETSDFEGATTAAAR
jgi:sugar transferase (PEP-CTERM/EpsH1 system associated)